MFFIQGLIIGFSWSAPIGMQNIYMFNNAVSNPRWRALAANFFVWLADVLLSLTAFFGIGLIMAKYQLLKVLIMLLGGMLVIWIGFLIVRSAREVDLGTQAVSKPMTKLISGAFMVTWANPQAIIDGTMMLGASKAVLPNVMSEFYFMLGVAMASAIWNFSMTMLLSNARAKLSSRFMFRVNLISGLVILAYGIRLIIKGLLISLKMV
ncbi:LysE/ArgO family amino acid transporter [Limosilactobacillus mucosae]|uniref:LysE/ArgO family amino acid transporter n=1 Tax=Limosilactobacillus mucosae TaxID=97478 RepID=UPI0022DF6E10|nr:LysE family transporter [Limosilactobacillus mucosae]